jgi:hypothetical protein
MTMHNAFHPEDERLAAYAGGDRDALSDRELAAHLAACDRCRPIVDELTLLRDALAVLPDVAPSRPLRFIPPAAAPTARRVGALDRLRRLAAPAMAAGAGLVLIGAVGASGVVTELGASFGSLAGGKAAQPEAAASAPSGAPVPVAGGSPVVASGSATDGSAYDRSSVPPRSLGSGDAASHAPASSADEGTVVPPANSQNEPPWLTLLIAGLALFGISAVLRYSLAPGAG